MSTFNEVFISKLYIDGQPFDPSSQTTNTIDTNLLNGISNRILNVEENDEQQMTDIQSNTDLINSIHPRYGLLYYNKQQLSKTKKQTQMI